MENAELGVNEELELELDSKKEKEIAKRGDELKKEKKLKKVFPLAVEGDEVDEKDLYVIFLSEPDFKTFSKFQSMGKQNEAQALRQLARDCYLDGDKELIDDDSLFLFGLMPQLMSIIHFRRSRIVNLSKAGK